MRSRTVLCACEDIELEEVLHAIELGYTSIEALKRLTAVTTGPCQGKWCLARTIEVVAQATGADPEALGAITHRPPTRAVPLGALARCPLATDEDVSDDEPPEEGQA